MVKGLFGDNIRDAVHILKSKKYKVEFPMCGHPELIPTQWNQPRPEPTRTIGDCPIHDYICPICGYGKGQSPRCECPERRY